jgi:hypothetical protein
MHKKLARLVTWLAEMLDRNLIMVPEEHGWVGGWRGDAIAFRPVPARRTGYVEFHITGCMSHARLC